METVFQMSQRTLPPNWDTVTRRKCGECSLCCKLPIIKTNFIDGTVLEKPKNTWCKHCDPGRAGCKVQAFKPMACVHYSCMWLAVPTLPKELRPDRCHVVFEALKGKRIIKVLVDPEYPDAADTSLIQRLIQRLVTRNKMSVVVLKELDTELYLAEGADPEWIIRQVSIVPGYSRKAMRGHLPKAKIL